MPKEMAILILAMHTPVWKILKQPYSITKNISIVLKKMTVSLLKQVCTVNLVPFIVKEKILKKPLTTSNAV